MQKTAAEEVLGLNLPTRRVESFHYTDLRALIQEIPEEASASDKPKTSVLFSCSASYTAQACFFGKTTL